MYRRYIYILYSGLIPYNHRHLNVLWGHNLKKSSKVKESIQKKRERILNRYANSDQDGIEVIPARPEENIFTTERSQRVAIYARVSTDGVNQVSSFQLQQYHYKDMISKRDNWELVDIYADEGISGTSLKHRDSFIRMINDCGKKKIDLIVTKSVSRFARNLVDCVDHVRRLRRLNPPIGVYFEEDNIYTLDPDYETKLSIVATMAQEESHTKSKTMNKSIEWRFMKGIFLTPLLYGYDHDEDGNLVVNEEEARVVSLIFFLFLYGYSCTEIARVLTGMKIPNYHNSIEWNPTTIYGMIKNERYCGDVLAHKTITVDYLEHKHKKNEGDAPQYYKRDHHEAIIAREDYVTVQVLIDIARHGIVNISPELKAIGKGVLKGFVCINPHWSKFNKDDYIEAAKTIRNGFGVPERIRVVADENDEDMSDCQVVRGEFLGGRTPITITFKNNSVRFSVPAVKYLDTYNIELLVEPLGGYLAVREAGPGESHSIIWAMEKQEKKTNKLINAAGFIDTIYDLFGWNRKLTYRINGTFLEKRKDKVLFFDVRHTEILIPRHYARVREVYGVSIPAGSVVAYKNEWGGSYGDSYYGDRFLNPLNEFMNNDSWKIQEKGVRANEPIVTLRNREELMDEIKRLSAEIEENSGRREADGNDDG